MPVVERLPGLLVSLSRALIEISSSSLVAVNADVTPNQYRALATLEDHGPMSVAHFASCFAIDRSTATHLCNRLVKKGLINRERSSLDHRSVNLVLTPKARRLLVKVSRYTVKQVSKIVIDVSERNDEKFLEVLELVTKAIAGAATAEDFVSR